VSFNNFYEFGMDKEDPFRRAQAFKVIPGQSKSLVKLTIPVLIIWRIS